MTLFWSAQIYNENVHTETYHRVLVALVPEEKERDQLMDAISQVASIGAKVRGAARPFDPQHASRLL